MNCSKACPKGLNPAKAIAELKKAWSTGRSEAPRAFSPGCRRPAYNFGLIRLQSCRSLGRARGRFLACVRVAGSVLRCDRVALCSRPVPARVGSNLPSARARGRPRPSAATQQIAQLQRLLRGNSPRRHRRASASASPTASICTGLCLGPDRFARGTARKLCRKLPVLFRRGAEPDVGSRPTAISVVDGSPAAAAGIRVANRDSLDSTTSLLPSHRYRRLDGRLF